MASAVRNALTVILGLMGVFFFIGGTTGLLRCPDLYSRLHPATKCDTMGAISIALAVAFQIGFHVALLKLLVIVLLLMLTSAASGHAIGRSAFRTGMVPWHETGVCPMPDSARALSTRGEEP